MSLKRKATIPKEPEDDEYRKKRERNNLAVKLCRIKSSKKTEETKERVDKLKTENTKLEEKIDMLNKNVDYLKGVLLKGVLPPGEVDIEKLLSLEEDKKTEKS